MVARTRMRPEATRLARRAAPRTRPGWTLAASEKTVVPKGRG